VSIITGVLFGLVPSLQSTKPDLVPALKDVASQSGLRRSWLRSGLVVTQISVSLLLLIASGLTLRVLQRLRTMNPGFIPESALMMHVVVSCKGSQTAAGAQLQKQLLKRVESPPGVNWSSAPNPMPLSWTSNSKGFLIGGGPRGRGPNPPTAMTADVGLKYFES